MSSSGLNLFSIGIGPSSSHTVGPMRAALLFLKELQNQKFLSQVDRMQVDLYGSLGLTGRAHGSEKAILLGLEGQTPEDIDPEIIATRLQQIRQDQKLNLAQDRLITFVESTDLLFHRNQSLPEHANGMSFTAYKNEVPLLEKIYYSIGGGFVVEAGQTAVADLKDLTEALPFSFSCADELLALGQKNCQSIASMMRANEEALNGKGFVAEKVKKVWLAMQACVQRGLKADGVLPGGLKVKRRAPELHRHLLAQEKAKTNTDPLIVLDWVNLYALAVNEENAMGGKVVTAPTNGAAGIIPAVLHYFVQVTPNATQTQIEDFLLTAGAIGLLYKRNASISGAEVGCQGEVGVACSMAAGALAAVQGGTNEQIENAAEIGMEHNLGLTCDPVGGLVQIPCIERNAMGSIKAINAARMALRGDGTHKISLDKVIKTMFETGRDMQSQYKETSTGGLAVNIGVVEC